MYDLVNYVRIRLTALPRTERGASAVEYGLLVALIAIAIIAGATLLGGKLNGMFSLLSSISGYSGSNTHSNFLPSYFHRPLSMSQK